jgi:hypothetical protein
MSHLANYYNLEVGREYLGQTKYWNILIEFSVETNQDESICEFFDGYNPKI